MDVITTPKKSKRNDYRRYLNLRYINATPIKAITTNAAIKANLSNANQTEYWPNVTANITKLTNPVNIQNMIDSLSWQ